MNFKNWLIKEDPDRYLMKTAAGPHGIVSELGWRAGRTFCLFDSYCLISIKEFTVIHEAIAHRIKECELAIDAVLRNEITNQELNDCLTSPSRRNGSVFLESKGTISRKTLNQFLKTIKMSETIEQNITNLKDKNKKPEFVAYRILSLKEVPDVILGRIWEQEKVISFWNNPHNIFNQTKNIVNFVKEYGNPKEYTYEIQNESKNYEEFLKGQSKSNKNFDTSIVHNMVPGEVKSQMQRMMGMNPSKKIDIRNKQLAYTSENHEL